MLRNLMLLSLLLAATTVEAGQNVVVVLDDSGSMMAGMQSSRGLTKMEAAKRALLTVLENLPPDARVGVVRLNGPPGRDWVFPLASVDQDALRTAVRSVSGSGSTPLGARMKTGADALLALRDQQHYGSYRLLIVTDGEATDDYLVNQYLPDILTRGIWVDVIGVDMEGDHSLATQVHTYRSADDPNSLEQAIREVFAESTSGPGDAGESDFELLAAIPDEVAVAALDALTKSGNHPIGEQPVETVVEEADLAATDDTGRDSDDNPVHDSGPVAQPEGSAAPFRAFGMCCCFVGFLFLVAVAAAIFFLIKGSKRSQ